MRYTTRRTRGVQGCPRTRRSGARRAESDRVRSENRATAKGVTALTRYELPFSDPTPDLAPTAARILEAAKRVLSREGFRGLTFETIAGEAGENPALIRYHFGSKAGLLAALVDSVLYQEATDLIEQLTPVA